MSVIVYRYGVPHWATLPGEVDVQLRLAHDLREDLVSLETQRQEQVAAVWSAHLDIARMEQTVTDAEAEAEQVARQAARERSQQRGRGATASTPRLRELRATIRDAKRQRRERITAVREQEADRLAEIGTEHRAAVKTLYRRYCQDGVTVDGETRHLYWATYNDVTDHHKTAVKRVQQARAQGKPAQLRHHRHDGSGALGVQLQRQAADPPRTPELIASGEGRWRNVLTLAPWVDPDEWSRLSRADQRHRRLGTARMALGHGRHLELPVIVHRMLPADADITGARLVVRRIGGHRKIELHVTARVPDPTPSASPLVAALHLGWRRDDAAIRVATWRTTLPVTVPAPLADVVTADTDRTGRIMLPARLVARTEAHDRIRADRDTALDKLRGELVAWLDNNGPITHRDRELTADTVARWRSPGRFARLALDWREQPPDGGGDIAATLEAWRAADRRMWEPEAHGRDGVVAARDDAYRRAAAWLTGIAGTLVVDDTVISEVARRPDPAAEAETPTAVAERAARQRTLAAPGRLRELAVAAAQTRGVEVVTVSHTGVTRTHYRCGHVNPADDRYARSRIVTCDGCGSGYDQDASATLVMLSASGHMVAASGGSARDTA